MFDLLRMEGNATSVLLGETRFKINTIIAIKDNNLF